MARTGGRNTVFAWFVGIVTTGIVAALVWFAIPAFPSVAVWVGDLFRNATGSNQPQAEPEATPTIVPADSGSDHATLPDACEHLYPESLWALLGSTAGAELEETSEIPEAAAELAVAIGAADPLVCRWSIPAGQSITTIVSAVGEDAPDIAATYLGAQRFACTVDGIRTDCAHETDGLVQAVAVHDGVWVMSIEDGWHPPGYSDAVTAAVWAD